MDPTSCKQRRRTGLTAIAGTLAWLVVPAIPIGAPLPFGSLEHGFVLFPLVAAPLGLALAWTLLRPEGVAGVVYVAARRAQPLAGAAVLAAFLVGRGPLAAALVMPWIGMALALAVAGITTVRRGTHPHLTRVNLFVAHVFLPIGTVWLLMSRLGVGPSHMPASVVMLAALHFHFSGFTLQVLIAATARRVPAAARLAMLHRGVALAGVVGIPLIAAGNLLQLEPLKTLGVATVTVATIGLAGVTFAVALATRDAIARRLLFASATSVGAAMLLAGIWRLGQVLGTPWVSVDDMVTTHGMLNAFGFIACGTVAHLRLAAAPGA